MEIVNPKLKSDLHYYLNLKSRSRLELEFKT